MQTPPPATPPTPAAPPTPAELRARKAELRVQYTDIAERTASGYSVNRITKVLTEAEPSEPIRLEVAAALDAIEAEQAEAEAELKAELQERAAGGDRVAQNRLDRIEARRQRQTA